MTHTHDAASQPASQQSIWRSLKWWPSLAAVAFAAFVALDLFSGEEEGVDLAPIVAASGLVYLAAAAFEKRITAWITFFASVVVITIAKLGLINADATWLLLGLAALLVLVGLIRGAMKRTSGLPVQTLAMLAFGASAAIALVLQPTLGAYLVAAGLFAHAGWDFYHHRANKVVGRSMSEFCFVLDVLLGAAIVIVTLGG